MGLYTERIGDQAAVVVVAAVVAVEHLPAAFDSVPPVGLGASLAVVAVAAVVAAVSAVG